MVHMLKSVLYKMPLLSEIFCRICTDRMVHMLRSVPGTSAALLPHKSSTVRAFSRYYKKEGAGEDVGKGGRSELDG